MTKHRGMPAEINGKKEKNPSWLWKTKMPPANQEIFEMPISGGCFGEVCLPSGYTFSFTFGFTHSETQYLWQGGFLVGFGKVLQTNWTLLLLPLKMLANLSQSATEVSCFNPCSENCKAVIAHQDWFYNRTFSRACLLIKMLFQGPLLLRDQRKSLADTKTVEGIHVKMTMNRN